MALGIQVKVIGGDFTTLSGDFSTVGEVKAHLGYEKYTAQVNGEDASDDSALSSDAFITLSQPVKGGAL